MAQLQPERVVEECIQESRHFEANNDSACFKFNVQAPEFVPRSHNTTTPISSYFYPYFQYVSGSNTTSDWLYVADQDTLSYVPNQNFSALLQKDVLPEDVKNKIIKQVSFHLSLHSHDFFNLKPLFHDLG